jgi:uncharacterized RDD family membrane protein YckC
VTQVVNAIRSPKGRERQGKRAGLASRVTADLIDYGVVVGIYLAILLGMGLAEYFLGSGGFDVPDPAAITSLTAQWVIGVLYLTASWAGGGRSIGKSVLGLRVVTTAGRSLPLRRAFVRAVICATVGAFTLLWVIVSRRRSAAHDLIVRSAVVYDWSHAAP